MPVRATKGGMIYDFTCTQWAILDPGSGWVEVSNTCDGELASTRTPFATSGNSAATSSAGGDDTVPTSVEVTVSGTGTYDVAVGVLLDIMVLIPDADGTFKVGTSAGASDIYEETLTSGIPSVVQINYYFAPPGTIHFTGSGSVKLFFRT